MSVQHYRQLHVWQKAMDLVVQCYERTRGFPAEERYGLVSQIRRASVSVAANIAEGQGRNHVKEFIQFIGLAKGSLCELETELLVSERVGFLTAQQSEESLACCAEVGRMLSGLKRALEQRQES